MKELPERPGDRPGPSLALTTASSTAADPEAELLARYPRPADHELAERVLRRYRQTALAIERSEGLRGLTLLDRLDLEAIFLYEKHPNDFRRLSESLSDDAAADLLLHWREYIGLKRADDTDRGLSGLPLGLISAQCDFLRLHARPEKTARDVGGLPASAAKEELNEGKSRLSYTHDTSS
jgi:hypothetical protein